MIQYFQLLMQVYFYDKSFAWLYWRRSFCFGTQRARLQICRCEGIWPKGYTNDGVSDDYREEMEGVNNQREACLGNPNSEKDRGCGEGCTWNEVLKWYQFQTGKIIPGFQHLGWDVTEARLGLGTQIDGRNNIHDNKKSLWVRSGHMEESQTWKSTVGAKMAGHRQKWVSNREGGFEALLLGLTGWGILNIELMRGERWAVWSQELIGFDPSTVACNDYSPTRLWALKAPRLQSRPHKRIPSAHKPLLQDFSQE